MTPEGRIKKQIKKILDNHVPNLYYYMPVPGGFGRQTLDYLGFYYGRGFAIEAKQPGGKPTPRQEQSIAEIRAAGAAVFVIDGHQGLLEFETWLMMVEAARDR